MTSENKELPWFSQDGLERDVIVSSRVRLARNLASFPFVLKFRGDDANRVKTIVYDAFSKIHDFENFHSIDYEALSPLSLRILQERGALKSEDQKLNENIPSEAGVIMNQEGNVSCSINGTDHLHLSCFKSGLGLREAFEECRKIDSALQEHLQFASSWEFGYLTACLRNAGSGMKLSCVIHLPCAASYGRLSVILNYIKESGLLVRPFFPSVSRGAACGSYYLISTAQSFSGSEIDQIAHFESVCKFICESERKILQEFADNKSTVIRNSVIRAYSIAKFSMLVSLKEAVEIISDIKVGLATGLLTGIDLNELSSLLYRIQNGHIQYLMSTESFDFEADVKRDEHLKLDRLRAIILQESFNKITLGNV